MINNSQKPQSKSGSLTLPNIIFRSFFALVVLGGAFYLGFGLLDDALGVFPQLRISGGSVTNSRTLLARAISQEAAFHGLSMQTIPTSGALTSLEMLDEGSLDFAIVPSGFPIDYKNIEQVATINPMPIVFFVDESIKSFSDLKGQNIEMGSIASGSPIIIKNVLKFLNLTANADYIETNYGINNLTRMSKASIPKVVVDINYPPAEMGDFLVQNLNYKILLFNQSDALKLRNPSYAAQLIQNNTYGLEPVQDTPTVGVFQTLLVNKKVDKRFVFKVLEYLYSPSIASIMQIDFDKNLISKPSGYPFSDGSKDFISSGTFNLSPDLIARVRAWFSLLVIVLLSGWILRVLLRTKEHIDDKEIRKYFEEVSIIEQEFVELSTSGQLTASALVNFSKRLSQIKKMAINSLPRSSQDNNGNISELLMCISDARNLMSGEVSKGGLKNSAGGIFGILKNATR